jgi:hypothetical protein
MQSTQNRRRFLATLSSAGAAGLIGAPALAQQAPPETTTIRLAKYSSICVAPYSAPPMSCCVRKASPTSGMYRWMPSPGCRSRHSPAARSTS